MFQYTARVIRFQLGKRWMSFSKPDPRFFKFNTPKGFTQMMPEPNDQIIISMSSGVDSSVCALMFSKMYKNVRGIFMANWSADKVIDGNSKCTVDNDWLEVRKTCDQLNIPCERVNFEKDYWTQVFEPMLNEYQRGLTPNPDIGCNKYVKFGKMIEHLDSTIPKGEKWWLVTGHYAKILKNEETGEYSLFRGDYKQKDQSYYLTSMPSRILDHVLMPIGHYTKPEVRAIANDYNLETSKKPDSQGLCFVSQVGKFKDFLNEYIPPNPGNIVTRDGKVWGQHQGLWSATIGQKCGISMPQGDPKYKGVWLVCDKDIEKNELIIAHKNDKEAFRKDEIGVDLERWHWFGPQSWESVGELIRRGEDINCQIRSLQTPNRVVGVSAAEGVVSLDEPLFGVAAGQTLALYWGDRFLGAGEIR